MRNFQMKRVTLAALTAIFATGLVSISPARAAEAETEMKHVDWTFDGPFGHFDRAQLQRGFKVYQEVCSACHSMNLVAIRTLGQEGGPEFTEAEVKAIAATYTISKDIDENGDVIDRPGKPSDHFPAPFANENAARASNGGALPPDFSVLAKARHGNADYIYSIVTGYEEPPADMTMRTGMHYNTAFHGNQIAMAQPIDDGAVTYDDGTEETLDQYAQDVAAFLYWTAEPKLEARNRTGFKVILFLILFAGLLYFTKKKLWRDVEH